ncbi:MAG TPA: Eco29kI family restriction endonuclease [Candidatus Limnocylindria bacterium]|nr:Eco29kI family restriction endonuclease [Candidatus Limnocylindria bacterium]
MLANAFESSHRHELADSQAPRKPGVYALYERGRRSPVYVGKAAGSLRTRLAEHARKVAATPQLAGRTYECRYLAVAQAWWVVLAETWLIRRYRPPWNGAGFAGHVPGSGRPGIEKSLWQQYLDGELSEAEARRRALPSEEASAGG